MQFYSQPIKTILFIFLSLFISHTSFAQSVTGLTFVPQGEKFAVGGELGYDFSPNSGAGLALRGQKQVIPEVLLEGGAAISGGKRERNLFLSLAKTFYPDYGWQPALTLKGGVEFSHFDDENFNLLSLAPIFSKGVKVVEQELYLFAGLPARLIVGDDHRQDSRFSLGINTGASGPLKFWQQDLFGTVELYFNARKSYNSVTFGLGKLF
jgi:hypothetical protein